MMMKIRIIYSLAFFVTLMGGIACAPSAEQSAAAQQQEEIQSLQAEVMEIHDEVMPRIGELTKLEQQLQAQLSQTEDEQEKGVINEAINMLLEADESMRVWMRNFEPVTLEAGSEEAYNKAKTYLESEKQKMSEVKKVMLESISTATDLLPKEESAE